MTWTTLPVSKDRAPDGTSFDLIGPEDAPLVVLIHGLGLARGVFDGILPALSGFRLLRYDLYGHGQSAPLPEDASLGLYARQVVGLLDHLEAPRAHILGFSIGGMINRRLALDAPERLESLVILNAPHDRGAGQAEVEARAKTVREQGAMATMEGALQRWFTPAHQAGKLAEQVRAWRLQADPESYAQAAWVLAHGVRELIAPEPAITARSLVMTCADDSGSTPAMSQAIAAEIPAAEVEILPGLKHLGLMEAPDRFGPKIRTFLQGGAPRVAAPR